MTYLIFQSKSCKGSWTETEICIKKSKLNIMQSDLVIWISTSCKRKWKIQNPYSMASQNPNFGNLLDYIDVTIHYFVDTIRIIGAITNLPNQRREDCTEPIYQSVDPASRYMGSESWYSLNLNSYRPSTHRLLWINQISILRWGSITLRLVSLMLITSILQMIRDTSLKIKNV